METTTLKAKHMSIFQYQIIAKHVTFYKGEYIGHLENIDKEENSHPHENPDAHTTSIITTKKMMSEQVEPDTFEPSHHKLTPTFEAKLETLFKGYES